MKAPVSAVLITRDDAGLEQAVASVYGAVEEVIVVDTGSTDLPTELPTKLFAGTGVRLGYVDTCNDNAGRIANFSMARNFALSMATQPWILTLDADDVVEGGEHLASVIREADRSRKGEPVRIFARYEYAYDTDGDCCLEQWVPRLVPRGTAEWQGAVHEELTPSFKAQTTESRTCALVWKHRRQYLPTREGDVGRNLRILEEMAKAGDSSPRHAFHMGCEYAILGHVCAGDPAVSAAHDARAEAYFRSCIARTTLADERAYACLKLADVLLRRAILRVDVERAPFDTTQVDEALLEALRAHPGHAAPYFELAKVAYMAASAGSASAAESRRHLERSIHLAKLGLELPDAPLPHNPLVRTFHVHTWLSDAYARTGDLARAQAHVDLALKAKPTAEALVYARRQYEAEGARTRIRTELAKLRRVGGLSDTSHELVRQALEEPQALRSWIRGLVVDCDRPHDREPCKHDTLGLCWRCQQAGPAPLRITFACGPSFLAWDPDILRDRGLGGSETAVIATAKRLAKAGHTVRVYANVGAEMVRDGVEYFRSGKLFASPPCDILVAWRNAALLEPEVGPLSVRARVLWVHDTEPAELTPARALLADRVFALSAWHREHLLEACGFHPDQVVQTRNGIDLERFAAADSPHRNSHKAIFSSSPDRGLDVLLDLWPTVRARIPDADLHVFYGFDGWREAAAWSGDAKALAEIDALERKAEQTEGVTLRGRVPPDELATEMLSAGVWLHPSWTKTGPFHETSCIGAMEARAAGCLVVAGNHGALRETADGFGCVLVDPEDGPDALLEATVAALLELGTMHEDRARAAGEASVFAWDGLEAEWETIFRGALANEGDLVQYTPYVEPAKDAAE